MCLAEHPVLNDTLQFSVLLHWSIVWLAGSSVSCWLETEKVRK